MHFPTHLTLELWRYADLSGPNDEDNSQSRMDGPAMSLTLRLRDPSVLVDILFVQRNNRMFLILQQSSRSSAICDNRHRCLKLG
jgi:hypothetical protein